VVLVYYYYKKGKKNIRALLLLNSEIGEQRDKLEFATVELGKSNAEKERILRVVAHDLRDPIGGAATLVNTLLNDDMPAVYEKQNLNLVEKTLTNSLTLINELMEVDLGKEKITLNKSPADIGESVKQCASLMQLIANKKNQELQLSIPNQPLNADVDKERMERMINNLIGNAIKFSPAGGEIAIQLEQKENTFLLSVKDNGIGIPMGMQNEIFNTLGNSRRAGTVGEKSFGLGLSICKQIVEAHNGSIWVQSAPGAGSMFFVEVPLEAEK
jgi:two-component system, OmpR family, sensor histidine kinase VicK